MAESLGTTVGSTVSNSDEIEIPREEELLRWLNTFISSNYEKIEDLRDSVAFAQILDAAIPDSMPMELFDYNASTYESYYRNASLLQAAMDAVALSSADINPDLIAVGQLEANFSLLYFCYTFITTENAEAVKKYNALERREAALDAQGLTAMNAFLLRPKNMTKQNMSESETYGQQESMNFNSQIHAHQNEANKGTHLPRPADDEGGSERVDELKYLVASLEAEMTSRVMHLNVLTENIRAVRGERDHYFDKLNAVEKACALHRSGPHGSDSEQLLKLFQKPSDSEDCFQDLASV